MAAILGAVNDGLEEDNLAAAMEVEAQAFSSLNGSEDMVEGLSAFREKRRPKFEDK